MLELPSNPPGRHHILGLSLWEAYLFLNLDESDRKPLRRLIDTLLVSDDETSALADAAVEQQAQRLVDKWYVNDVGGFLSVLRAPLNHVRLDPCA